MSSISTQSPATKEAIEFALKTIGYTGKDNVSEMIDSVVAVLKPEDFITIEITESEIVFKFTCNDEKQVESLKGHDFEVVTQDGITSVIIPSSVKKETPAQKPDKEEIKLKDKFSDLIPDSNTTKMVLGGLAVAAVGFAAYCFLNKE